MPFFTPAVPALLLLDAFSRDKVDRTRLFPALLLFSGAAWSLLLSLLLVLEELTIGAIFKQEK